MSFERKQKGEDLDKDYDRPAYHVQPQSGWLNDPNGPIFFQGQYHIFFQHVPDSSDWQWRIQWGHCVSKDLVNWQRLPDALVLSPDLQDANGCWSGCCTIENDGQPYIIYTGVVLNNPRAPQRIKCPQQESVCWASLAENQNKQEKNNLVKWTKNKILIDQPPPELGEVYGWRDPFIFQNGNKGEKKWTMIIGAGEYQKKGMILMYEALELEGPWKYVGKILEKPISEVGTVCECPLLVKLPPLKKIDSQNIFESKYLLAAGAYEYQKFHPEALSQPVFGWIGEFNFFNNNNNNNQFFNIFNGPFKLDYGDAYYAATCQIGEDENEVILWAWMMETPERNYNNNTNNNTSSNNNNNNDNQYMLEQQQVQKYKYEYSGCLGIPRIVFYDYSENLLVQLPHSKLNNLREKLIYDFKDQQDQQDSQFFSDQYQQLQENWIKLPHGNQLEIRMQINCQQYNQKFLKIYPMNSEYWISCKINQKEVIFYLLQNIKNFNEEFEQQQIQQKKIKEMVLPLNSKEQQYKVVELIIFIDGSVIEIFSGSGKSLCTRLYGTGTREFLIMRGIVENCQIWKLKDDVII